MSNPGYPLVFVGPSCAGTIEALLMKQVSLLKYYLHII
jgi:hypothetical protein